jgi:hypothetical protein
LSAGNLRATLTDAAQRFPQLEIELIESSRKRLATALRNGGVGIAIVPGAAPLPENRVLALWSERILVAIPEGHPLAERQAVYWIDLKDETVLLSRRDPGPELHDLLIATTASPGDRPKIVRHDVSRGSLMSLVGAGFGITLLTEAAAGANFAGVVYREVRDAAEPARIGYSAHWREDNQNPALASFLKVLGERLSLADRRRLTPASEFGEGAIRRYEFFQHGCDELGGIDGVLSGFARKRLGVGHKIAMQRRGQVDRHSDRLVVFDRAELQLRHVKTSSLKRRVRGRDRG